MMSMQKQQVTWAEIVKGKNASKAAAAAAAEQKFQFNAEVQEFKPTPSLSPAAKEFVPADLPGLNPSAKDFDPKEARLMQRAAEVTSMLLECYSDSDDDDNDDEPPRRGPAPTAARVLNPNAKVFSPPAVEIQKPLMAGGFAAKANCINLSYCSTDDSDSDSDSLPPTSRIAVARPGGSPAVAGFRPPPGLTLPDPVALNMDSYSSDDETPRTAPRGTGARKLASVTGGFSDFSDSDSTSAGKSSDSDSESI